MKRAGISRAKDVIKTTAEDIRWVKRLRALGASNYEISQAMNIPEDHPLLHK